MNKKEARLSPRARKLLEGARKDFPDDPKGAAEYLTSVDPKSLNLYDRHKIGREILRRISTGKVTNARYQSTNVPLIDTWVEEDYDVIAPGHKEGYEDIDNITNQNIRLSHREAGNRGAKAAEAMVIPKGRIMNYWDAGKTYEIGGFLNKALNSYEKAIKGAKEYKTESWESPPTFDHKVGTIKDATQYVDELKQMIEDRKKRLKGSNLEGKLPAVIAISGLAVSIFFLSSNVTGNVTGLSQTSSSIIGALSFIIGLAGAFFYFRKNNYFSLSFNSSAP